MNLPPDQQAKYNHAQLEFLREIGRELTLDAETGKIKPILGRENEIRLMIETLCRETKSNPVLIGAAGVGKTALVEGLADKICHEQVPEKLRGCRLFSITASSLIAGCNWYGMIETRVKNLLTEAKRDKVIVFIDEIHTIVGTSPDLDSTRDIAQQLKPALSRGEIKFIGATTDEEYRQFIETDEALERRFQPIRVPELSVGQTFSILKKLADEFTRKKKIEIGENILRVVLSHAERFLRNRHFPDKAIDLLEQTVAFAESNGQKRVTANDTKEVIQRMLGMPSNLNESLHNLAERLTRKELWNEEQTRQFCDLLRVSIQGLSVSPGRPNATVFLPGASAAKSSAFAETIAEELFGAKDRVIKLNFTELSERWEFNQMLGIEGSFRRVSPDSPIAKISKIPWCVIVCEGLESSSRVVQQIWARAVENGFLIDGKNKKIYLSDAIIVMSADVPASFKTKLGFSVSESETEELTARLEKFFSKSLIGLCDFIVFENETDAPNTRRNWLKENLLNNLSKRFGRQGVHLHWDKSIIEILSQKLEESANEQDWERLINFQILPALLPSLEQSEKRLSVSVRYENDEIVIDAEELPESTKEQIKLEDAQKRELYARLELWLRGLFHIKTEDDFSKLAVFDATLRTDLYFSFWKEQLIVSFLTPVADVVQADADLYRYLLEKNMSLRFGKLALETDGRVWLEYSMFGEQCDAKSFLNVLRNITETARKYKEKLRKQETSRITSQWLDDEAVEWLESRKIKKRK